MNVTIGRLRLLLSLILCSVSVAFECQQFTAKYNTFIDSPGFPSPRPPGNYVCEYILNPKKFSVRIVFSDFFLYGSSVQESLLTNCLQGDGDYIKIFVGDEEVGMYCAASKSRPPPVTATGHKLTLRYVVRSTTTRTSRPGFHATCEFTKDPHWFDKPQVLSEYILANGDGHTEMTLTGPGVFDIMLLIQSSDFVHFAFNATNNISSTDALLKESTSLVIFDGSTSKSLIAYRQNNLDAFDFDSTHTTMFLRLILDLVMYQTVSLQFVYAFCTFSKSVGGSCPSNYYPCEGSFHCIPDRLLCDSYNHCPDSSDEIYCNEPCLKCRNGGWCDQETEVCNCVSNFYGSQCHFYACGEVNCNQGVCEIVDLEGNSRCFCHMGYSGDLCDVQEEVNFDPCPCERKNRCQMYFSISNIRFCDCYDNYYGPNCEYEDNWNYVELEDPPYATAPDLGGHANHRAISKLWIIMLTAFGIFFLIVFCCCIAKRGSARGSRSTRGGHPNSTNGATRNGMDTPQIHNQAPPLIRSSSSLFAMIAAWRRATMRPQTPPPSYDAIEPPMYCMVATDIAMNARGDAEYSCIRTGHQQDAVCGTITRESSGLPDVITDGEMRSHIGQSVVSQV